MAREAAVQHLTIFLDLIGANPEANAHFAQKPGDPFMQLVNIFPCKDACQTNNDTLKGNE